MLSMTGFGKAEYSSKVGVFTVEMSSVNNRFLEISIRLPRQFSSMELSLRDLIKTKLNRGKIHVFVNFDEPDGSPSRYPINIEAAETYYHQLQKLRKKLKLTGEVSVKDLLVLPEIATASAISEPDEVIWKALSKVADKALNGLVRMRTNEGKAMAADLTARIHNIERLNAEVQKSSRAAVEAYREKLTKKVEDLLGSAVADQVRLETEVALMAERTDISEECTRLESHAAQFKRNLKKTGPIGKKLNFILQEMNREANTIAAKCSDIEISRLAISIKEDIEKLREQVQNVE